MSIKMSMDDLTKFVEELPEGDAKDLFKEGLAHATSHHPEDRNTQAAAAYAFIRGANAGKSQAVEQLRRGSR